MFLPYPSRFFQPPNLPNLKNNRFPIISKDPCKKCSVLLTLTGMGLPAILALAISELVLRGTLRLVIPPSSSELERWPWPWVWSGAWSWPWFCRMQKCCLKLTLYLGNQYILYRRQRVTYTVLKPRRATHTVFISLHHTWYIIYTRVVGKGTNAKQKQKM